MRRKPARRAEIAEALREADENPGHARDVKSFVRHYAQLQENCASAFNHNREDAALGFIDQMRALERRIRFLPEGQG